MLMSVIRGILSVIQVFCSEQNLISQFYLTKFRKIIPIRNVISVLHRTSFVIAPTRESNYQLNFSANHRGYVNITDMPDLSAFTLCFWMRSSDHTSAGTPFWYRVRYENKEKYVTAIALLDYRGFYVHIGETHS